MIVLTTIQGSLQKPRVSRNPTKAQNRTSSVFKKTISRAWNTLMGFTNFQKTFEMPYNMSAKISDLFLSQQPSVFQQKILFPNWENASSYLQEAFEGTVMTHRPVTVELHLWAFRLKEHSVSRWSKYFTIHWTSAKLCSSTELYVLF